MRILVNDFAGHSLQVALSRHLAKAGNEVMHVYFAANNTPKGLMSSLPDDPQGLTVHGLAIPGAFEKHSLFSRRQSDIAYGRESAKVVESYRPDIVLSANMPIHSQSVLQESALKCGAKFVYWVQDIYSEAVRFVFRKKSL